MAVEVYLEEELRELAENPEVNAEWKALVESLQLSGQLQLISGGEKSAIPFPQMNDGMKRVYNTLCPKETALPSYSSGTIPLRVLSAAALCKEQNYFAGGLWVWSDEAAPDPILVGKISTSYSSPIHLIARWGDELRSYPELVKLAIERKIKLSRAKLEEEIEDNKSALARLDSLVSKWALGDYVREI